MLPTKPLPKSLQKKMLRQHTALPKLKEVFQRVKK